jgi:hypothetical protein
MSPNPHAATESPMERAKRLSRELVSVDNLVGITERVPVQIPALPRVTTQVVKLNPELWPDLQEDRAIPASQDRRHSGFAPSRCASRPCGECQLSQESGE